MRAIKGSLQHNIKWIALLVCLLEAGIAQASVLERLFAPEAELWAKWERHAPESEKQIDHSAWGRFLQSNVVTDSSGINRIAYARIDPRDKKVLLEYLSSMQRIEISSYTRPQQLAYWINLYNALTIKVVLEHYPVASIRDIDISPGFFSDGPWGKKLIKVENEMISLNDIEHRILRPIWKNPRIHYMVNCASLGCPNLRRRALTASNVEKEMDAAAREYINHTRGVRIKENELHVSSIYNWFSADFGENEAQIIEHITQYADTELKQQLKGINAISGYEYDWSLNDSSPTRGPSQASEE